MENILYKIRNQLKNSIDKKTQATSQNFFREKIKYHGVKTAIVSKISKEHFNLLKDKTKTDIFEFCDKLWQSGYIEESFIACKWSYFIHKDYEPCDFEIFEKWIDTHVNNWASCDTLCNHTVGEFIEMYPEYLSRLKKFTASENRWMRRASAVSLIVPARKGKFLNDIFERIDDIGTGLKNEDDILETLGKSFDNTYKFKPGFFRRMLNPESAMSANFDSVIKKVSSLDLDNTIIVKQTKSNGVDVITFVEVKNATPKKINIIKNQLKRNFIDVTDEYNLKGKGGKSGEVKDGIIQANIRKIKISGIIIGVIIVDLFGVNYLWKRSQIYILFVMIHPCCLFFIKFLGGFSYGRNRVALRRTKNQ